MGMPDEYDRDCEDCGCFGGSQITICLDCLKNMGYNDFLKLKQDALEWLVWEVMKFVKYAIE